jgi:hypothetical protein
MCRVDKGRGRSNGPGGGSLSHCVVVVVVVVVLVLVLVYGEVLVSARVFFYDLNSFGWFVRNARSKRSKKFAFRLFRTVVSRDSYSTCILRLGSLPMLAKCLPFVSLSRLPPKLPTKAEAAQLPS